MSDNRYAKTVVVLMCTIPVSALNFNMPLARELRKNGYEVVFCFADGDEANIISAEGFEVKIIGMRRTPFSLANIAATVHLSAFLKRNNVEVIQTSTPIANIIGRLAAVIAGVPIRIIAVWGMFPRESHKWQSILFDFTEMILHRINSYTLTLNEEDKKELLRKGFAKQNRITCLGGGGFGVDFKEFDPYKYDRDSLEEMKKELGMQKNDFVVTFIGRLTVEKGILDYIEALAQLSTKIADVKGLVVGDVLKDEHKAISKAQIEALLLEKGINKRVTLTGHSDNVPALMAISDVVVLPSKREGFGQVLAEAAVMEKPVVAYRCRGTEEAVIDGKTGFLIEPGNIEAFTEAIQYLYDNKDMAGEIGQAARTQASTRFNQEEILKNYLSIYEQMIDAKLS